MWTHRDFRWTRQRPPAVRSLAIGLVLAVFTSLTGCVSVSSHSPANCGPIGDVPRELSKTSLPLYVIEPPDVLLIEAVNNLRLPSDPLRPADVLLVRVANTIPVDPEADDEVSRQFKQINGPYPVQADGRIDFGPEYGKVLVGGLILEDARTAIINHLRQTLQNPQVWVTLPNATGRQEVAGEHLVRPDGTVSLGVYGQVYIAGLTTQEARQAIEQHLARWMTQPEVHVDVLAYNSKVYYVVTDGGGAGEQVLRFPCTGNETVLDAISQINGLPVVASKKHIWVARPAPAGVGYDQTLPVDWNAVVRGGATDTNYQVLPGDRIYVQADHMITFDTFVAKVTSPFERIMGFTLLGNGTVRSIQFGHRMFSSNNSQ